MSASTVSDPRPRPIRSRGIELEHGRNEESLELDPSAIWIHPTFTAYSY